MAEEFHPNVLNGKARIGAEELRFAGSSFLRVSTTGRDLGPRLGRRETPDPSGVGERKRRSRFAAPCLPVPPAFLACGDPFTPVLWRPRVAGFLTEAPLVVRDKLCGNVYPVLFMQARGSVSLRMIPSSLVSKGRSKEGFSVYGLFDRTRSPAGRRCLKEWMLKPLRDVRAIHARQVSGGARRAPPTRLVTSVPGPHDFFAPPPPHPPVASQLPAPDPLSSTILDL